MRLELIDSSVVYRNPNPGYRYTFACHSHLIEIGPDELLCTFQRGQALYSVDSALAQMRSRDGGKTWAEEPILPQLQRADRRHSYHGPQITRLADGSLIMIATRWDRSDPEKPLFNETTGGILRSDTLLFRSRDGGTNWIGPEAIEFPAEMELTPASPIVLLSDGRWFLSCDQWHAFDAPGPYKPRTVGVFSIDSGRTWVDPIVFGDGAARGMGHWHGRIIRLQDGRLFTLFWTAELATQKNLCLHRCIGSADGRSWSEPAATNIPGQTNWSVDLGDGRMFVIYTVREGKSPGFFAALSQDAGLTWDIQNAARVWDATGRDKIGVHAPESYPRSHDTIAYGAPTATQLLNGDLMVSFWCTEMSITQIRCARLRVS